MGLQAVRVFLVEDEALVAMSVEDMLADLGCAVAASACTLDEALDKVEAGDSSVPARCEPGWQGGVPGYRDTVRAGHPFRVHKRIWAGCTAGGLSDRPLVSKPFQLEDLATALSTAVANKAEQSLAE